jgi:dUTPase
MRITIYITVSTITVFTCTEWITSAFAVHPRSGLGVATELANVSVSYIDISYNPFVQLSLIINNKLNDHNKL